MSFYYLAGYLLFGGVALLLAPQIAASMAFSKGSYSDVMLRGLGMFMTALGSVIVQLIRLRVEVLYPTTLGLRTFFCICLTTFYLMTGDPMFLVLVAIVLFGVLWTSIAYTRDKAAGVGAGAGQHLEEKP
ncbi:MAG: hypothetical protein AAF657_29730 [Acidobacteriota bacterium]